MYTEYFHEPSHTHLSSSARSQGQKLALNIPLRDARGSFRRKAEIFSRWNGEASTHVTEKLE